MSDSIGGWHCTACHLTTPDLSALSGRCDRSADGEHRLYVQLGQGYPNDWDGAPCTCARPAATSPVIVIVGASFGLAATVKILAALAVIWLVCWYVGRLLEEREHRANMRRMLERGLARRHGRGRS